MYFQRLKELREYEGFTQADIARYLNVRRGTYAGWETGKDIIPIKQIYKIANLYKTSIDYLTGLTDKEETIKCLNNISNDTVSTNLVKYRKELGLTQTQLAKSLNTTQSNIHKYETGKCIITTLYAIELAKKYNCSLDIILGRKTDGH